MINLKDFIKYKTLVFEGQIDTENLPYKIESWFANRPDEKQKWDNFCNTCEVNHRINTDELEDYYNTFSSSTEFVDYINDNVTYNDSEANYKDMFMNIVRQTVGI